MPRLRLGLGLFVSAFFVLSFAAHSLAGWSEVRALLEAEATPPELVLNLGVAWRLGGASMLIFAAVSGVPLWERWRGRPASLVPAGLVGVGYALYGLWAWVTAGFEPFFFVLFVVPGALLTVAATTPPGAPPR